ncbi:hypothetical protein SAV31267_080070 [Streptomyces avermitilis]|uniref:Uncharacterized protein n=1 Tax=Streptomyces avermitilis TaxID=33903 RepID=A0A4D4N1Z3_STRAX|nr:hypothetical protein SAVMC3_19820 [Streptomyces avermitilis]GDY78522.1 hypothetical protein SAV31267_080070 [Streptomyces avermitilis]
MYGGCLGGHPEADALDEHHECHGHGECRERDLEICGDEQRGQNGDQQRPAFVPPIARTSQCGGAPAFPRMRYTVS